MKTVTKSIQLLLLVCLAELIYAQSSALPVSIGAKADDPIRIAQVYIRAHLDSWGLNPTDISEMSVSDNYVDLETGIQRIYFQQRFKGVPVYNALLNVCIDKNGKVFYATNRFVSDLAGKIISIKPEIRPDQAIDRLVNQFGLHARDLHLKVKTLDKNFVYDKGDIARVDILTGLSIHASDQQTRLAWDILFCPNGTHDQWSARVDAITGEVLVKNNWTLSCQMRENMDLSEVDLCRDVSAVTAVNAPVISKEPQYNVWPAPFDSPEETPRIIVSDPHDPVASPYGWHDTNGVPGPEYTVTGGNNVYAYQDRDNLGYSSGDEPDGGTDLHFDFPYDPAMEPEQYKEAAVVNLFYWMNYLHDFTYQYGFTEASGNFQKNNYGRGGLQNDFIWAVAQDGANSDTLHNNAEYVNQNDGLSPSIFMFDFLTLTRYLTVEAPSAVAGQYITNLPSAGWGTGAYVTDVPVTGEVVVVDDGVESPSTADACQDILNASSLAGKIALIDRGACQFAFKALQAQNAGAIGVIICSADNKYYTLAAGTDAANVQIPIVSLTEHDCRILRQYAGHGLVVSLVNPGLHVPHTLDSDLEGSLIAHEYGHGVSIRLAGGPDKACLDNAEQMGEGWSDFLGLITTVKPGDTGAKRRAFASYINGVRPDQNGLRRYPYSTDISISPLTYGDVETNQEKHNLGEVWADMLWDMYWAFVDQYGFSDDLHDHTSGNYKAIRLVFDGLKNMACDPGFVDGRNAILAADEALYQGENACLIWKAFARRGLGYSADQGSPYDAGDQKEAFDLPPACLDELVIEKSVTGTIQAGDDIQVNLKIGNYKPETVSGVKVTDEIPAGTSFKINSSNIPAVVSGNDIEFNLDSLVPDEETTITYTLQSSAALWSERLFQDDVPDTSNTLWISFTIGAAASNNWVISDTLSTHSGNYAWHVQEIPVASRQVLQLNPAAYTFHVTGDHPALRFYHRFQTQAGHNGGLVDIREVGTTSWKQVGEDILRNGYSGTLDYRAFLLPGMEAFSGSNGTDFESTYIDLSNWQNKDIEIRFRFATMATTAANGIGWIIDDVQFMDLLSYNGEACVVNDQGDIACAAAPAHGTIVETAEESTGNVDVSDSKSLLVFPNPATNEVTIRLPDKLEQSFQIALINMDGREVFNTTINDLTKEYLSFQTKDLPDGLYMVSLISHDQQYATKVIVQH